MAETTSLQTPLHDWHREKGARLVPFAGWEMPVQYTSILEEHRTVRQKAGLFDVSHMGVARIRGVDVELFLDFVATNELSSLRVGRARYSPLCNDQGGTVDDVIFYKVEPETFLVVLNAANAEKDLAWLEKHANAFDVTITDESVRWSLLAVQGPDAVAIVDGLTGSDVASTKRFSITPAVLQDANVLAARTGYTGEDGFELFIPAEETQKVANALVAAGAVPCGLGARDSLRLEAGMPLYGHELSDTISPLQAGLGWAVKLDKSSDFLGKRALAWQQKQGVSPRLIHFVLDAKWIAREGTPVFLDGQEVGRIASGSRSPIIEKAIGSAFIDAEALAEEGILTVERREKQFPLEITSPPLHKG